MLALRVFLRMASSLPPRSQRLIWIDTELTGLHEEASIVEIACIVTEGDLTVVAEAPDIVIHHSELQIDQMNDFCKLTFPKNGLLTAIRTSTTTMAQAEQQMLDFVRTHTDAGTCPLAGNSVSEDRRFLRKCMPQLAEHLHYRTVDVSTIKELAKRWFPDLAKTAPPKAESHRALDDIRESIAELQYYRTSLFKP